MTKEQFEELQLNLQQSDMNLKTYLKQAGVSYSTYNYWRKKLQSEVECKPRVLPQSVSSSHHPRPSSVIKYLAA